MPAFASAAFAGGKMQLQARNVFLFLLAFRITNALCLRTFFQPDEYFQALEPAWHIAFGEQSGAWITWVRIIPSYPSLVIERASAR